MSDKNIVTGASVIIKSLVDSGIEVIFGYPGGAVLPIYDELFKQDKLQHILVRHEQAAVHAAEGYARSTGKIGAVLVTSGPGATNTVTGLTDALMDSIPIICITGQVPTAVIGTDAFQEADTIGITTSCTKHNYLVKNPDNIQKIIKEAIHIATTGRPGPVLIDIPKDVQNQPASYNPDLVVVRKSYNPKIIPNYTNIEKAIDLIVNAKKPLFYTGGGIINSGKEASILLDKLVRKLGYPVTSTLMGLGCYPTDDELFLGMLGMHGSYEANMAMYECDVMINIGARFDDRVTGNLKKFSPNSIKIHVDIDGSSIDKTVNSHIAIIGDAKDVLATILKTLEERSINNPKKQIENWWNQINEWRKKNSISYNQKGDTAKPQYVLDTLNDLIKGKDYIVTTDVGQHQMWAAQYLDFVSPNRWLTSGGLGTMGYGMPAAIGAQIANPDKLVICVTGEASIQMNIQELSTIKQYRLPIKVLVLNNHYMGMVRQWQEMFHGNRHSESYMDALPDFVKLAEAYGLTGMRCDKAGNVKDKLQEMLDYNGMVFMDMIVDDKENVYPMIPAGSGHHEMELSPESSKDSKQILDINQV